MTTPVLTIAIPTWDRNELLRKHVAALLPQLNDRVQLRILDNASPKPVAETLAPILDGHANVDIIRHRVNIGSSANVMRCIELCSTPWLWILGDDDRPLPNAIETALATIAAHPECTAINFTSMHANPRNFETDGLHDFVQRAPNFANLTLISNNLLRADRLSDHIRTGYFFAHSLYPHTACVLSELNLHGGKCSFRTEHLIEWCRDSHWSKVMAGIGMGMLLDLPVPNSVRKKLVSDLMTVSGRLSSLAVLLLDEVGKTIDPPTASYLYEQAYQRLFRHERKPSNFAWRCVGRLMLWMPRTSSWLYRKFRKLRGDPRPDVIRDDMARM